MSAESTSVLVHDESPSHSLIGPTPYNTTTSPLLFLAAPLPAAAVDTRPTLVRHRLHSDAELTRHIAVVDPIRPLSKGISMYSLLPLSPCLPSNSSWPTMPPPCIETCLDMSIYRFGDCPTIRECPASGHCLDLLLACALAYLGRHAGLIILPHQHLPTVHSYFAYPRASCETAHLFAPALPLISVLLLLTRRLSARWSNYAEPGATWSDLTPYHAIRAAFRT